jgi:hypothetical protein
MSQADRLTRARPLDPNLLLLLLQTPLHPLEGYSSQRGSFGVNG